MQSTAEEEAAKKKKGMSQRDSPLLRSHNTTGCMQRSARCCVNESVIGSAKVPRSWIKACVSDSIESLIIIKKKKSFIYCCWFARKHLTGRPELQPLFHSGFSTTELGDFFFFILRFPLKSLFFVRPTAQPMRKTRVRITVGKEEKKKIVFYLVLLSIFSLYSSCSFPFFIFTFFLCVCVCVCVCVNM